MHGHPFAARFLVAASLLFVITLMWSIASPVPSGPDEEAQLIKSGAIVRGTLIGTPEPGISAGTVKVRIPETIANAQNEARCDYGKVDRPACSALIQASPTLVVRATYEGRYPPIYYFLTGLPTLLSSRDWTLHAMRLMSALICSLLLGAAFACVATYGRSGLLTLATAMVVTPTVLYISAVVNPSALEIAGAIAMWAALVVIVMHRADDPPLAPVVIATVGAMAMSSSRPLSTLWYALILASVFLLRPAACRALCRLRRIRVALGVSLVFAFVSGVYVLVAKSYKLEAFPLRKSAGIDYDLLRTVGKGPLVLVEAIGDFGSPNFTVPLPIQAVWIVAGFGLITLACLVSPRRDARVLVGATLLLGFLTPFVIILTHVRTDGVIWQGRYSLPIITGLPLIAAVLIAEHHPVITASALRRLSVLAVPLLTFGTIGAFYWYLRRYTVGLGRNRSNAFRDIPGHWSPVAPPLLIFAVLVLASLAFGAWLLRQTLLASGSGQPTVANHARTGRTRSAQPL
jgi:hypothetical protein